MKNYTTLIALLLVTVFTAKAQTTTATATLNLKLNAIQSITVHSSTIDLEYNTVTNYQDGVSVEKQDHLEVFSTGRFVVNVSSTDLVGTGGTIESETVEVTASEGSNTPHTSPTYSSNVALSQTLQPLIQSTTGGAKEFYNVTYTGVGFFANEVMGDYTATVTYTISPN